MFLLCSARRLIPVAVAFVSVIAASRASAQTSPSTPSLVQFGIGGAAGIPAGDFAENVDSAGGVSMHVGFGVGESPVMIGTELTYLLYGSESRKVPFSAAIPDALIPVNTDNQMVLLHGVARAQPNRGRWRPYADVVFGFNYIFTQTSVDLERNFADPLSDTVANTTNFSDFALSYGGGAGVMVQIGSGSRSPRLDMSLRYLAGGEADYLRKGAIRRENGQGLLAGSKSRTEMGGVDVREALARCAQERL